MIKLLQRAIAGLTPAASKGRIVYDSADPPRPKFLDASGNVWSLTADGLRDQNMVVNGGYDYAQRQVPGTLTTYSQAASRQYAADQWCITNENTSVQFRRVDTTGTAVTGHTARFYGEYTKITSTGKIEVSQPIPAGNCQHLRGRKVRFQAKLRCSASKTIRMLVLQLTAAGTVDTIPGYVAGAPSGTFISAHGANSVDPTFGTNLSKVTPDTADNATIANSGLSCSATTAFQRFGGVFTMPADFKNLVLVFVTDSQFVAADRLEITEVGLYDGAEVRDWAERMQQQQLSNAQGFYAKSFNIDINPAASAGVNTGESKTKKIVAGANAGRFETIDFPEQMRAAPTITFFNPAAAGAQARDETNNVDCTVTTAVGVTERQFAVTFTGNAATVAEGLIGVHWTADASL